MTTEIKQPLNLALSTFDELTEYVNYVFDAGEVQCHGDIDDEDAAYRKIIALFQDVKSNLAALKTQTHQETNRKLYSVITNSDTNEGRGGRISIALCESKSAAIRLSKGQGIQGYDADVTVYDVIRIGDDEYIKLKAVPIHYATLEDKLEDSKREEKQKALDKKQALIDKMRKAGFSDDEIAALQTQ